MDYFSPLKNQKCSLNKSSANFCDILHKTKWSTWDNARNILPTRLSDVSSSNLQSFHSFLAVKKYDTNSIKQA